MHISKHILSLASGLAVTAATTGLALIDPRSLSPCRRVGYRAVSALIAGWAVWDELDGENSPLAFSPNREALTVAAVGTALGFAEIGEVIDAKAHDALAHRGVRHPRRVMAAIEGGIMLYATLDTIIRRRVRSQWGFNLDDADVDAEQYVDVPPGVRAVARTLLEGAEGYGSVDLLAQLERARAIRYDDENLTDPAAGVTFHVPGDVPLAVPQEYAFPVIGRFAAPDGRTFDMRLRVSEGRLSTLDVSPASDWSEGDIDRWYEEESEGAVLGPWPTSDHIELWIETPQGLTLA